MSTHGSPGRHTPKPVLVDSRSTWLTYETFYGLTEKPFSLSSDPRFFYHSRSHALAFDELLAGIRRRESLSVLTGDIGMGKTTLCRAVIESLDRQTFSAIVPDPFASREDLLKVLLMDFGVASLDDLTSGRMKGASRTELSYLLYEFLATLAPLQAFAVVIIDEAQNLSVPLLEEIRILSDSDGRDRQLQVVLVGQLELRQKLMLPEMRQVDQRVSVRGALEPLDREGVAGYVAHRLQVAGASPAGVWFTDEAIELVHHQSGGVPRLINRICDRALNEGYLRRATCIDEELVEAAVIGVPATTPATVGDPVLAVTPRPADVPVAMPALDIGATDIGATDIAATDIAAAPAAVDVVVNLSEGAVPIEPAARIGPPPAPEWTRPGGVVFPRDMPPTALQQFRQRWAHTYRVAALCVVVLGAIGGAAYELQHLRAELAAPTQIPRLPATPQHPAAMPAALAMPAVPDVETVDARP